MVDPRTSAYLREMNRKAQDEPCQCSYCVSERKKGNHGNPLPNFESRNANVDSMTEALKSLVQERKDKLRRLQGRCNDEQPTLYDKTIPEPPSNFHPELSSNLDMWDYSKRHSKKV